ncbi:MULTISPECIES: alpha/beta hydrolase fold domain-containing protein [Paraburkholderia]|uniref:alpha/beta hydrolase fold domain-containing protein n=1 Tax=Paraburkholderia TaxID=1822464 RepID=UPI0003A8C082|nr:MULTISPECIES: alpha/beta hydrolase fold domain-containing protein [Paraburkholderia]MDH6147149.1 hypothetical protein [Paraburkholderia sp. WSM4179]
MAVSVIGKRARPAASVDYRMPPEAYFFAALDDVETVYKSVFQKGAKVLLAQGPDATLGHGLSRRRSDWLALTHRRPWRPFPL